MKCLWAIGVFWLAGVARATVPDQPKPVPPLPLRGIGIDQRLNAQVPLYAQFADESGRTVELGDYLGRRPAILALVYYTCPMLCDQILRGLVRGLRPLSLAPGRDFDVIAISINPSETAAVAAAKRRGYVNLYGKGSSAEGWHFLTGTEPNVRAVADAVGYHYRYDPKTRMFFHAAGVMVLTPEGKAARYLYGVEFQPKDLKLGLIEAAGGQIGTPVDRILLFCYHYDPLTGKYTATVLNLMRLSAAVFLLALAGALIFFWRRDLQNQRKMPGEVQRT